MRERRMRSGFPRARALAAAFLLTLALSAWGHEALAGAAPIGFDERLGRDAALDAVFTGEDGAKLRLGELVDRPVLLNFVYYRCKDQCTTLLVGIAQALHGVDADPGLAYRVVTVSVNDEEGPADALGKKALALASVERPFPPGAWRFLVGTDQNIDRLADSVGLSYVKHGEDFDHPLGIVVLSPKGKIVRYMNGTDFLPLDVSMAILEASSGIVRPTIAKLLRLCLSYNPQSRQFGFNLLRVSGIVITVLIGAFVLYLILSGKRRRLRTQGSRHD
jgi:protein SCO1/2